MKIFEYYERVYMKNHIQVTSSSHIKAEFKQIFLKFSASLFLTMFNLILIVIKYFN